MVSVVSLRHAILGFLALRPLTGYDLKKHFDASVQHFWTADQAQIYRTLGQLQRDGLVDVTVVAQADRPDRKEHHITQTGRDELDAWLAAPHQPQPAHEPFLLKVFFAARLPPAGIDALLDTRIAAASGQLDLLRAVALDLAAKLAGPDPTRWVLAAATLDNGIRHVAAELDWLRDLRAGIGRPDRGADQLRERLTDATHHPHLPQGAS
jgi:DNA-binding PadR family transcriptional regulator